ncbi:MAG TPA: chemotaxis protein CheW [Longimicrobiales bacterium]|nr:chemotaxis protein CheW [Longimicrobiales bacterium]
MTTNATLQSQREPLPEHLDLLRARARRLSMTSREEAVVERIPAVAFTLSGERFGIDARAVLHVSVLRQLTTLPAAAPPLFGVTHWRGSVLTILDLRDVLGLRRAVTDLSRFIVIAAPRRFGILADAAHEIVHIDAAQVRPLQSGLTQPLLRGITDDGILVIDHAALLRTFGVAAATTGPRRMR